MFSTYKLHVVALQSITTCLPWRRKCSIALIVLPYQRLRGRTKWLKASKIVRALSLLTNEAQDVFTAV